MANPTKLPIAALLRVKRPFVIHLCNLSVNILSVTDF